MSGVAWMVAEPCTLIVLESQQLELGLQRENCERMLSLGGIT